MSSSSSSSEFRGGSRKDGAKRGPGAQYHLSLAGKSPSPEFMQDEESASICPLLTPNSASPSEADPLTASLEQKMLLEGKSPSPDYTQDEEAALLAPSPVDPLNSLAYERRDTPSSVDTEMTRISHNANEGDMQFAGMQGEKRNALAEGGRESGFEGGAQSETLDSSESSGSFALQETNPCAEFLSTHLYQQLNKEKSSDVTTFITQDGGKQSESFDGARKVTPEYGFFAWNWPAIRKSCFWSVVALMLACLCAVVGIVSTMPRRCYPYRRWYHGSVFYEIFPGSFQDSDHDGIGDLRGIASRAEYLSKLGVTAIRLNSIFPARHYPEGFEDVTNLTEIEKSLGSMKDWDYLEGVMRSKNISIVIDLPIHPLVRDLGEMRIATERIGGHRSRRSAENDTGDRVVGDVRLLRPYIDGGIAGLMKYASEHLNSASETIVADALRFWFDRGVDGVYIKGLEKYARDPRFLSEVKKWKDIKESYPGGERMLMCEYKVLLAAPDDESLEAVLTTMDLLDVHLDLTNGTSHVKNEVNKYRESRIYDRKDYPWLHWNIGDVDTRRLSTRVENNLGALLFELLLPGTVSIFYGDEIGLQEISDPHSDHRDVKHVHQLAPMNWSKNGTGFTRNDILPWIPFAKAYKNSETLEMIVFNVTNLRRDSPSIYMSSIWKENENLSNHAFRYIDQNLIVLERSYPRRKSYAVVFNIGGTDVHRDLSNIYYGGELIEDVKGSNGLYVTFNNLKLRAGESFIFKLDT